MQRQFELKKEHINLVNKINVSEKSLNPIEVLGNSLNEDNMKPLTDEELIEANKLHKEVIIALQIILENKSFEPGQYYLNDSFKWIKRNNKNIINRVEVIDNEGRSYTKRGTFSSVETSLQDQGRTLKLFID